VLEVRVDVLMCHQFICCVEASWALMCSSGAQNPEIGRRHRLRIQCLGTEFWQPKTKVPPST